MAVVHSFSPGDGRGPKLGIRFFDQSATRDKNLRDLQPSPSASPAQRRRLQQIVAQINPCTVVNEHCSKARPADTIQTTPRRGKVQRGRAHARYVWIDTLSEDQIETGEVPLVLCWIATCAPNRLHEHPVRGPVIEWPLDLGQGQRDDLWSAIVRR